MSEETKTLQVHSAALSDRGLNERRPLNEDAFLHDPERTIFAVADGVGGAEAGEVASQTAIEVLDEAFRHQTDNADIEDLMELAIQRANASIHQMAQEHARFSMMATTIVALHIKGVIATFGHVGDSRLYRLTPDGQLHRETEDHSIVEEEVRAGRMTPEQAANHPSKNVISRALGAEQGVEVDMKTMEVEDGTEFLLCTDGITRHISDNELRQLMVVSNNLDDLCAELKRRCYERGAEDNLTVIAVRVGEHLKAGERSSDLEPTISPDSPPVYAVQSDNGSAPADTTFLPASRIAFPGPSTSSAAERPVSVATDELLNVAEPKGSGAGRVLAILVVLLLLAGAFYAGARYREKIPFLATNNAQPAQQAAAPANTPAPEEPFVLFERARRQVDQNPDAWLKNDIGKELIASGVQNPLDSPNAEFLYLYGRANLLTGNTDEAAKAFDAAIAKADSNPSPANVTIKREAVFGLGMVSVKTQTQKDKWKVLNHYDTLTKPASNAPQP
ncbi:MAG TPA: PP2C family serine/threonine-protein phosphatase [Pyrinomonadaceae bacterium]|nr:PP2C family serine/threonine-protein phosphatase [Pyrinomonadaceae bacterium]